MAAMHWEARRKQKVIDRSFSDYRDLSKKINGENCDFSKPETHRNIGNYLRSLTSNTRREQTDQEMRDRVREDHLHVYSAKLPNRYSSLNYKQQW
uniref:Uncharacterized protein n=1 Tax=Ciona intestinalis TaxID=7719 RepID=H2XV79_CIOIN